MRPVEGGIRTGSVPAARQTWAETRSTPVRAQTPKAAAIWAARVSFVAPVPYRMDALASRMRQTCSSSSCR